ncbi:Putative glutamate--cysteine ligase 2 [Microbacterium oxydans]|uniref:Putative glutamate--cysteine ligase 2 n=1 Tax=Microbacterium oxydans TaxID=82380 RepID=A0A0F0LGG5_9MICO|nr:YbdK family carboxylate-amine ligase [Microbacterium oxydans]KJL30651.1 Carboxylate-amine ligase YbdK [Microbacterium oxydans]CAH0206349.1 Putative glutamate--cysteine ligase 2 [Microbacterium oxydans]
MARFGIEEEFVFLDDATLVPIGISDTDRESLADRASQGRVLAEYLTCQVECVTDPVDTLAEAGAQVRHLRGLVDEHATTRSAIAAASGTAFATTGSLTVVSAPHYDDVASHLAHITRGHEVNGLHVHVEIGDDEERVRALNRVRGWLPVLLALTGNSPFADGVDTRFASWRSVAIRRLPSSWSPPRFHDLDDYRSQVDRLIELHAIADAASLSWAARVSDRFPTLEVRVFDAQLHPDDTLFAAALTRAIAVTDDLRGSHVRIDQLDASLWTAARHGMHARLVDPASAAVSDARTLAGAMLDAVRPALEEHGDLAFVEDRIARIGSDGTGADRQRAAFGSDGVAGLGRLYRDGMHSSHDEH